MPHLREVLVSSYGSTLESTSFPNAHFALVGSASITGKNHPNEDRVSYCCNANRILGLDLPYPVGIVLVCDGHDGAQAATFIQEYFLFCLKDQCASHLLIHGGDATSIDWNVVLRHTFSILEATWTAFVHRLRQTGTADRASGATSGSCVTAALLVQNNIFTANLGDCKAILSTGAPAVHNGGSTIGSRSPDPSPLAITPYCTPGTEGSMTSSISTDSSESDTMTFPSLTLTGDHRCCNPEESRRIIECGGFIRNNRVIGILEPTRTIGDLLEKERSAPGVVSATPDSTWVSLFAVDTPCGSLGTCNSASTLGSKDSSGRLDSDGSFSTSSSMASSVSLSTAAAGVLPLAGDASASSMDDNAPASVIPAAVSVHRTSPSHAIASPSAAVTPTIASSAALPAPSPASQSTESRPRSLFRSLGALIRGSGKKTPTSLSTSPSNTSSASNSPAHTEASSTMSDGEDPTTGNGAGNAVATASARSSNDMSDEQTAPIGATPSFAHSLTRHRSLLPSLNPNTQVTTPATSTAVGFPLIGQRPVGTESIDTAPVTARTRSLATTPFVPAAALAACKGTFVIPASPVASADETPVLPALNAPFAASTASKFASSLTATAVVDSYRSISSAKGGSPLPSSTTPTLSPTRTASTVISKSASASTIRSSRDGAYGVPMLIVATDGVWDVLSNAQVMAIAQRSFNQSKNAATTAAAICQAACHAGSRDDISAIVCILGGFVTSPAFQIRITASTISHLVAGPVTLHVTPEESAGRVKYTSAAPAAAPAAFPVLSAATIAIGAGRPLVTPLSSSPHATISKDASMALGSAVTTTTLALASTSSRPKAAGVRLSPIAFGGTSTSSATPTSISSVVQ